MYSIGYLSFTKDHIKLDLLAVKFRVIGYYKSVYEMSRKNALVSKKSGEVLI